MHYHFEVWVKSAVAVESQVEKALMPFMDDLWDWYMIGGRYKGSHVDDYEWDNDPDHKEKCSLCSGTGRRPDVEKFDKEWQKWSKGCNGCMGTGVATKWPTNVKPHALDIIHVSHVSPKLTTWGLLLPKGKLLTGDRWSGKGNFDGNVLNALQKAKITDGFLVTVDCHN